MYNVQFKFIRGQRVRVVGEHPLKGDEFEIATIFENAIGRRYGSHKGSIRDYYTSFTEDDLELVDQPVDLTQPAEVEAAKVGS